MNLPYYDLLINVNETVCGAPSTSVAYVNASSSPILCPIDNLDGAFPILVNVTSELFETGVRLTAELFEIGVSVIDIFNGS